MILKYTGRLSGIFLLCILPYWMEAQQEISAGVRVNRSFRGFITSERNEADNTTDNSTQETKSISGDILIEFENSNQIFYRTRIGYGRRRSTRVSRSEFTTGSIGESSSELKINEIRIAEGIGIHREFDRINLRLGIEVPFIYRQSEHYSDVYEQFVDGVSQGVSKTSYDKPKVYTVGLMLFSGIYYTFWKTISVGFELSSGIDYSFSKGSYNINHEFYDPLANTTSTDSDTQTINSRNYDISFLSTSIGFLVKL